MPGLVSPTPERVAIIGAGVSGATCARRLAEAGVEVQLFDKSRGVAGRMATRRMTWSAADGLERQSRLDHGATGFSARSPAFSRFAEQACRDGLLARWLPVVAPDGRRPSTDASMWVPKPDMPALCRELLAGLAVRTECTVTALRSEHDRWSLESDGAVVAAGFDAVLVTVPAPQAAPLLHPHRADWAERARSLPMAPAWTLMGVTDEPDAALHWNLARPSSGPLAMIVRDDRKPGREPTAGRARWVVHACEAWSRTHLESPPSEVLHVLQEALAQALGCSLAWHHATVHRWRYAAASTALDSKDGCWWDATIGLGACGDAFVAMGEGSGIDREVPGGDGVAAGGDGAAAGGDGAAAGGDGDAARALGVERAWMSGRALADALVTSHRGSSTWIAQGESTGRIDDR